MSKNPIAQISKSKNVFTAFLSISFASKPIDNNRKVMVAANNDKNLIVLIIVAKPVWIPVSGISIGSNIGYFFIIVSDRSSSF